MSIHHDRRDLSIRDSFVAPAQLVLLTSLDVRMLEDPSYAQIVRWGDSRDSFVVLEVKPLLSWSRPRVCGRDC